MTLEKLTLTQNTDGYEYEMYPITEAPYSQRKPAFSVSPPGVGPENNVLLGIQGQQADIRLQFAIWDDGSDRANGTYTSTVISLADQIQYLRDEIHKPTFSVTWTLDHTPGDQYSESIYTNQDVYVESMEIPTLSTQNRRWLRSTMTLRRGGTA